MSFSRNFNRRPWAAAAIAAEAAPDPDLHQDGAIGIFRFGRLLMGEMRGTWRNDPGLWEFPPTDRRTETALRNQDWRLVNVSPPEGEVA